MKTEANYEGDSLYEDFEPYCKWKHEVASAFNEADVLEIQLRGFKKEELKSETGNDNLLCVSGEHPVGKRIMRFTKKIDVSQYDVKKIEATFENGNIHLRLPIKSPAFSVRGNNGTVGIILPIGNTILVVLLLVLAFYMYKYSLCTNFQNWFK